MLFIFWVVEFVVSACSRWGADREAALFQAYTYLSTMTPYFTSIVSRGKKLSIQTQLSIIYLSFFPMMLSFGIQAVDHRTKQHIKAFISQG
jgi:hypothetical protein